MKVVQLSDLHFVKDLGTKQSRYKGRAWFAKSHDFLTLSELGRRVRGLDYDVILVSGDLATDGSTAALQQARRFVEDEEIAIEELAYVRKFRSARRKMPLKCLKSEPYLVLPGNHDRYGHGPFGQIQKNSFEEVFPKPVGSCPYVYVHEEQGPAGGRVVFIVLDSTWTRSRWAGHSALAVGKIDQRNLEKVTSVVDGIRHGSIECEVTGKRYLFKQTAGTALVVALHHHPVIPGILGQEPKSRWSKVKGLFAHNESTLTRLDNADAFRKVCEAADINVVMFGHQHLCYQVRLTGGGTLYSCCSTSTGFSKRVIPWAAGAVDKSPGFLQYEFDWRNGQYELCDLTLYRWEGQAFIKRRVPLNEVLQISPQK
ncbi:MAG TPA: metallophosphoesterase [Streptosporangiaceae bacterium]|jgi:hypothetical protein